MSKGTSFFIQDSFPLGRVTINAGVLLDWIDANDALFDFAMVSDLAIGPRVGANYALTADNKNILRASYGRVGDVPNSSYIGTAGSAVAGIRDEYDNDLDGAFESVFFTPGATRVSRNRRIEPDRRWPWVVAAAVFLLRGVDHRGRVVRRIARRSGMMLLLGWIAFALGLRLA